VVIQAVIPSSESQRQDTARLERRDAAAVHAEALLDDDLRFAENLFDFGFILGLGFGREAAGDGLGKYLVAVPAVMDDR